MSVIVADSRNASYTGKISTANGFYRAEAYNMTAEGSSLILSTARTIAVTFANAGNCAGIALCLYQYSNYYTRKTFTVELQENVASVWTTRVTKTSTQTEICPDYDSYYAGEKVYYFVGWAHFKFATPYAVDTTAGKWRFRLSQGAEAYSDWYVKTSDNTNISFVAWCNTAVTYSNTNDAIVCADKVYIDANFNPKPYTGTGDTTFGVTTILTASTTISDPWKLIVRPADLAASYTWTIDGVTYVGTGCGVQIGKRTDRIPYANRFNVSLKHTTSLGQVISTTVYASGIQMVGSKGNSFNSHPQSLEIGGEIPTLQSTTLSADALNGQNIIKVVDSPTTWSVGDKLYIGKSSTKGQSGGDVYQYFTITSMSGNDITLDRNLGYKRWAGGAVINADAKYGVKIATDNFAKGNVTDYLARLSGMWFYDVSGFMMQGCGFKCFNTTNSLKINNTNEYLFEDCTCVADVNNAQNSYNCYFMFGVSPNTSGFKFRRVYAAVAQHIDYTEAPNYTYKTLSNVQVYTNVGQVLIEDCRLIASWNNAFSGYVGVNLKYNRNLLQNIQYTSLAAAGNNCVVTNNEFWGQSTSLGGGSGTFVIAAPSLGNATDISGNTFDNNSCGIMISGVAANVVAKSNSFGQVMANTIDIGIGISEAYAEIVFQDNIGNVVFNTDNRTFCSPLGFIRFANYNSVANDNREYQAYGEIFSTGTGLSDTTAHNSGFAMRFSSVGLGDVRFAQKIPTGNIQNKDMMVGVWVNIASANYWAGSHTMPRLTITYDGGTVVYAEAAQVTGWQYIFVPFTPTTTAGLIEAVFTSNTAAVGANSYVYFDDFSALYPAGYQLNLGNMDLWFEGAPVTPMIATNLSAQDVWAADPSQFGASTVGDKVNKIKTDTGLIPALL